MKSKPKIFSTISFKVLSAYPIDESDEEYINNQLRYISDGITGHLNRVPLSYKNNNNQNMEILNSNLNQFINHYNKKLSDRLYLWLDSKFIINENELFLNDLDDDDENDMLEIALNMHNELLHTGVPADQDNQYIIFSICLFLRNSPIAIVRYLN